METLARNLKIGDEFMLFDKPYLIYSVRWGTTAEHTMVIKAVNEDDSTARTIVLVVQGKMAFKLL